MAVSRVIEVSFGRSSVALVRIDTAYFYNNGIIFKPTDLDLPASYQVHWTDSPQATTTLETIGTAEGAPIPDDLWNRSRVIYGWIYLHPTEDSGITAYEVRIYKNVRAGLPDGTEPTPAEQSTIDQLIGALNSAVEQAEDAQEAIEDMSVSATTLAEGESATVTKSEQDGVVHLAFGIPKGATGDDGYSPTASVTKSGKTATITITDKNGTTTAQVSDGTDGTDGEDGVSPTVSVTDITDGHRVVITDKDGAKSFDVEDGATGATPNLTIGTVETLEPTESATATITGTPENPVLNLGIPQGEQGEVTLDEFYKAFPTDTASGSIASFSDGADGLPLKSLIVDINPVQDLHGQESPYPAGGGKNLFNGAEVGTTTPTNWGVEFSGDALTITHKTSYSTGTPKYPLNLPIGTYIVSFASTTKQYSISLYVDGAYNNILNNGMTFTTEEGKTYSIVFAADEGTPNVITKLQIESGSAATAYAPYENICPISGWTSVDVEQSGVNLFDGNSFVSGRYDNADFSISSASDTRSAKIYLKAGTYTLSADATSSINRRIINGAMSSAIRNLPMTFTLSADGWFGFSTTDLTSDFKLELGSTATPYSPYTGRSITIQLGQTVYGGKLDVLSGVLTVDRAMVDLGTLNWVKTVGDWQTFLSNDINNTVKKPSNVGDTNVVCSVYKTELSSAGDNYVYISLAGQVRIKDTAKQDLTATDFKIAMSGVQLVYELAEPIEIQLSANQINSLLGVNNIWADSGDTTAEYRADTKLFIERLTAPDSADMIADVNITSGQYFMVGNSLYKATANIANGGQIIVGTNCIRKSLSEALNEINA